MKPIRWRSEGTKYNSTATVEGVRLRLHDADCYTYVEAIDDGFPIVISTTEGLGTRQQIDAAAYALSDLVATLKGME